jgi:mannose-6-phosphate isomerase-like protein (cupin superfamily)
MPPFLPKYQVPIASALAKLGSSKGETSAQVLSHGSLVVQVYAPRGVDPQRPHTRDELYVVVKGAGTFFASGRSSRFQPGDVIFVPAGVDHRFEHFSDDLAIWVIFYGPEGGESGLY